MQTLAQLGETFRNRIAFVEFIEIPHDGRQNVRFYFDNGLCMSVGCNGRTYSDHSEGLYEIAVIVSEEFGPLTGPHRPITLAVVGLCGNVK